MTPLSSSSAALSPWWWLLAAAVVAVGLVVALRGRRGLRSRLGHDWKHLEQILRERGFTTEERAAVRAFIRRRAPWDPVKAVTTRREFEACVEAEMGALYRTVKDEVYQMAGRQLREWRERLGLVTIPMGQPLQSTRGLAVGQPADMGPAQDPSAPGLRVRVVAMDEAYFHVQPTAAGTSSAGLRVGDRARFSLWRDDDARYALDATLVHHAPDTQVFTFLHASELQRHQARAYLRVRHEQATQLALVPPPTPVPEAPEPQPPVSGRTVNLSAGGVAVISDRPLPEHSRFRVRLVIPGEPSFDVEADVVASEPSREGGYLVRACFVGLREDRRDALVRYALHAQMRHVGLEDSPDEK